MILDKPPPMDLKHTKAIEQRNSSSSDLSISNDTRM